MKVGRLSYFLAQLSVRERLLLFVLSVVVLPVAVCFLLIVPMIEARDRAQTEAKETRALLDWVVGQVKITPADVNTLRHSDTTGRAIIGLSGLEDSLVQSGLREQVTQLANRADGGIDLVLENADFISLSTWLTEMSPIWGYSFGSFRFESASPGIVHARFELLVKE